ncbi:unnamed protein product [Bursaphelenchus xylophilus]|uniref:glutathione transferase n=1 Tax=Bursaphelenchus xylophilus TaxID=6326 RepID=A0A1I7RMF8_BURXY|nr:unnamed protein product [Bursaphelenchus xylophilus]CAG9118450.1 unnamed protein product [Bursaphelenchus xylophilus]
MPEYKLYYFDARGRAEPARLILNYAKIPFEDVRVSKEEWEKVKGDKTRFPYGQMPVLLIDGTPLAQSNAINRYLAVEAGLAGENNLERGQIGQIEETCRIFNDSLGLYRRSLLLQTPNQETLFNNLFVPTCEKQLPVIEEHITSNGFFHSSGVTYVDLFFADLFKTFYSLHQDILGKYPKLVEHMNKVHALPELQEYLSKRGENKF